MRAIAYDELIPQQATFSLEKTKKTYTLNPMTIADANWIRQKYGESIQERFLKRDVAFICALTLRLMIPEDLEDFVRREVTTVDESGVRGKVTLGGVELMKNVITGPRELLQMIKALTQTIGFSQPLMEEIEGEIREAQKKSLEKHAGAPSSNSAFTSGDSPLTKSAS